MKREATGEMGVSGASGSTRVRGNTTCTTGAEAAQRRRLEILNQHLMDMGRPPMDVEKIMTELAENRKRRGNRGLVRKG